MKTLLDFQGHTVVVVGGSSGIGNGIAQGFRSFGAEVHVWGTRASAADYAGVEGSDLEGLGYYCVDVTDYAAVANASGPERVDAVILSQGLAIYRRGEFEMEGFTRVIDINLNSLMACANRFRPELEASQGTLTVISSTGAYRSTKGNPAYAASKAGTLGLIRSLAEAWAAKGVRVNGIAPGMIDTKLTKVTTANPDRLEAMLAEIPLGRLGQPSDIAGAALYLASPLASYVTGQMLVVDGGSLLS